MSMPKIAELFLIEVEELLSDLEDGLLAIEERGEDRELINTIFRAAHTIKGSAGLSGFEEIVAFTHVMENVLERVRTGSLEIDKALVSTLLASVDVVKAMVELIADDKPISGGEQHDSVKKRLEAFLDPEAFPRTAVDSAASGNNARQRPAGGSEKIYDVRIALESVCMERGQDPAMLVMELGDYGRLLEVEVDFTRLPPLEDFDPLLLYLKWRVVMESREPKSAIENVFIFVIDESDIEIRDVTGVYKEGVDISIADKKVGELLVEEGYVTKEDVKEALSKQKPVGKILVEAGKVSEERVEKTLAKQQAAREVKNQGSIRVDTEKLDKLVNLVGELVTGVSQVNQSASTHLTDAGVVAENDEMMAAIEALDQVSRDLQEQVMLVRMVPIEATFNRFKRVVRDLAEDLKKEIKVEMYGTETELDKNVIERLADPLKHLIRNAVDHGIESPEKRIAVGKAPTGKLWLKARQREGSIIIEVSDDGRGIDRNAVLKKARERGLIEPGAEPSEKEIFDFLFHPGFSTAASITNVSGRGVGMDVVKRNIEELRGNVEVASIPGSGTTFRIRLPLTLAIIEGMNVRVGDEILTVPLLSIVEQIRPRKQEVKTIEGAGEVVDVRGEYLPLVRLHNLFKLNTDCKDPTKALVIVLENDQRKYGLMVDTVLGQQQAVIKALDTNYRKVDGVSGATILGDGRVSLILDPHRIEQMAFQ